MNCHSQIKNYFLIFLFFFSIYFLVSSGRIENVDGMNMFQVTQSLVEKQSFKLDLFSGGTVYGPDGNIYYPCGLGHPMATIPFFLAGKFFLQLFNIHQNELIYLRFFVSLFNPFITALTCLILFIFFQKLGCSYKKAFFLTSLYGFATISFPYAKYCFNQPLASFCLLTSIFFLYISRQKISLKRILIAGFFFGYVFFTRNELIVLLPIILICFYLLIEKKSFKNFSIFFLPILFFGITTLFYNKIRFGNFFETGYNLLFEKNSIFAFNPILILKNIFLFFFDINSGIIFLMPISFIFFFSFFKFWQNYKLESLVFFLLIFSIIILYSCYVYCPLGGWCWGPRFLVLIIPFLSLPTIALIPLLKNKKILYFVIFITLLSIAIQILVVSTSYLLIFENPVKTIFLKMQFQNFVHCFKNTFIFLQQKAIVNKEFFLNNCLDFWFIYLFYIKPVKYLLLIPLFIVIFIISLGCYLILNCIQNDNKVAKESVLDNTVEKP
ncbi:MAG: hypothetical protein ABIB46_03485 [bacterium]